MSKKTKEEKNNKSEADSFLKELNSYIKSSTKIDIESIGEHDFVPEFLDTGNYALNWACTGKLKDGGIPMTKCIEFFSEPGQGKSLVLTKFAGENIKKGGISYIVDTEDAVNPMFAKVILNDPKGEVVDKIQRIDSIDTIEQLRNFLVNLCEKKIASKNNIPIFIGIDSVSQLSSEKEMEDARTGSGARDMTKAQAMRGLFRVVNRYLRPANITIVALSQTSSAIGGFGNPITAANHGGGLKFASSLRLWITSGKEVLDSAGIPIGVRMNFKVEKNRMVSKGRKASVNLSFRKGIQKWSGLLELLAGNEILKLSTKDIKKTTKVVYEGEEFSASKLDEWVQSRGGEEFVLEEWQKKLDEIYSNFADEESFEEASENSEQVPIMEEIEE